MTTAHPYRRRRPVLPQSREHPTRTHLEEIEMTDRLAELTAQGVSLWLDDLSRQRLQSGNLQELIDTWHISGVTTNPSIFQAALSNGAAYQQQLDDLAARGAGVDDVVREVTTDDVRDACEMFTGL